MKIQDIAKEAGVSSSTVSRVFANNGSISSFTRDKVMAVARKYSYHPRLSVKRRNVVIVTPSKVAFPAQNYTEMVLSELSRELSVRNYRVEILPLDNIDRLDNIQFCAVVAIGVDSHIATDWDKRFDAPLILIDRPAPPAARNVFAVHSDEQQGMDLAIEYLYNQGYRRIGILIGSVEIGNPEIRREAIFLALAKHGLPCDESLVRTARPEQFVEEIGKLLRADVDSLFCPGGHGGIISAYALSLYNRRIPDDIALIASERSMVSCYCIPAQTTISQDYPALAYAVMVLIDARINGVHFPDKTVFPYKLIIRDSVKNKLT
ncbi:MAG: LacI family DNA-binding transcriptional regulator [Victivallales bacterium]|nr:LacI family DNA-binding transcriptional regulator [Victivallales bacterium]